MKVKKLLKRMIADTLVCIQPLGVKFKDCAIVPSSHYYLNQHSKFLDAEVINYEIKINDKTKLPYLLIVVKKIGVDR